LIFRLWAKCSPRLSFIVYRLPFTASVRFVSLIRMRGFGFQNIEHGLLDLDLKSWSSNISWLWSSKKFWGLRLAFGFKAALRVVFGAAVLCSARRLTESRSRSHEIGVGVGFGTTDRHIYRLTNWMKNF